MTAPAGPGPDRDGGRADVVVAVPTFRREAWTWELLSALHREVAAVPSSRIVVLDNDPDGSAAPLRGHPVITDGLGDYVHVGAGDVVSVRNRALGRAKDAGASFLVFIDDDELPVAGWLRALLRTQGRFGADVVAGPVSQQTEVRDLPHAFAVLRRSERAEGPFAGDVGSGNVLVSMDLVRRTHLRFDPRLARTGGEDALFFRQALAAGAQLCWAPAAVVVERPNLPRLARRLMLRRSFRNGQSSIIVEEAEGHSTPRAHRLMALVAVCGLHGARAVIAAARGDGLEAWRSVHKISRHTGRLVGSAWSGGEYGGDSR